MDRGEPRMEREPGGIDRGEPGGIDRDLGTTGGVGREPGSIGGEPGGMDREPGGIDRDLGGMERGDQTREMPRSSAEGGQEESMGTRVRRRVRRIVEE